MNFLRRIPSILSFISAIALQEYVIIFIKMRQKAYNYINIDQLSPKTSFDQLSPKTYNTLVPKIKIQLYIKENVIALHFEQQKYQLKFSNLVSPTIFIQ